MEKEGKVWWGMWVFNCLQFNSVESSSIGYIKKNQIENSIIHSPKRKGVPLCLGKWAGKESKYYEVPFEKKNMIWNFSFVKSVRQSAFSKFASLVSNQQINGGEQRTEMETFQT